MNTIKNGLFKATPIWVSVILLTVQNLILFHRHYFDDYGFPWDFMGGYYTMVSFWTSVVGQGVYPSWVPYVQFGLPINSLLQSGIHYLPLWIFPALKIEYTLHAAVVFQCLHILFGAIGMLFLLRLLLGSAPTMGVCALFGAYAYQFFGGFYSNAEHVDIIRAFSFYPWLFYFFAIPDSLDVEIPRRFYLIPLMILLVTTGAYPGNIISGFAVAALYVLFQLIRLYRQDGNLPFIISLAIVVVIFTIMGVGLSFFHLGPAWLYKNYLYRSTQISRLDFFSLGIEHIPALFLETNMAQGEISMTSTYITLPVLILFSYTPLRIFKREWPMMGVLLFSSFMVAGPSSFFWYVVTKLLPPLKYSRFPASDYRAFVAIAIIYFAALALSALIGRKIAWKNFLYRTGLVFLWFFQGMYVNYPVLRSIPVYKAVVICLVTISILAAYLILNKNRSFIFISLFLIIIMSIDALRVLPNLAYVTTDGRRTSTWLTPSFSDVYQANNWPLLEDGHLLTYKIIQNTPSRRPSRFESKSRLETWVALITGQYDTGVNSTPVLESAYKITDKKTYREFMTREWFPLFFDEQDYKITENNVEIPRELLDAEMNSIMHENIMQVHQLSYGMNKIKYRVSLTQSVLMLENETFFPGWTASLALDQGSYEIQAISVNGLFRAWLLPAGEYYMTAQFEFPHIRAYNGISIVALITWVFLSYRLAKRRHIVHM